VATTVVRALGVVIHGEPRIVGKVLDIDGELVYYRRFDKTGALFRQLDAYSFDSRLVPALQAAGVTRIHYDDCEGKSYSKNLAEFVAKARPGEHGEEEQLYLPVAEWDLTTELRYVPWTQKVEWIST